MSITLMRDSDHFPLSHLRQRLIEGLLGFSVLHRYTPKHAVRIVVQHTRQEHGWCFRLIAYEDARTYRPLQFERIDDLSKTLGSVVPDFKESDLAIREDSDRSYVAFSADWELTTDQLFLLGLKE